MKLNVAAKVAETVAVVAERVFNVVEDTVSQFLLKLPCHGAEKCKVRTYDWMMTCCCRGRQMMWKCKEVRKARNDSREERRA